MSKVILTQQEKSNLSNITATSVIYDNTTIGMQVENVQTAIDSLSRQSSSTINKVNEIISPETLNLYNLPDSATSNDVFNQLGQYNLHTWRRWPTGTGYVVTLGETITLTIVRTSGPSTSVTVYYSNSATANSSGVSLSSPSSVTMTINSGDSFNDSTPAEYDVIKGKYIRIGSNSTVYYVPNSSNLYYDEEWSVTSSGGVRHDADLLKVEVQRTGYAYSGSSVTYQYLTSTDENAYPKSGTSGSWNYEYLGVPFENMLTPGMQFEVLQYTGTGGKGPSNKNKVTASFKPKIVFLGYYRERVGNSSYFPTLENTGIREYTWTTGWGSSWSPAHTIFIPEGFYSSPKAIEADYGDYSTAFWFQVSNNTISWWIGGVTPTSTTSGGSATYQYNTSGTTYYVGVLG